ncbi:anti-sigma factor family protein [Roseobacter sinensis]|uniref:Anti-sigma factor n=1 Tax=Roseobacter sinensis TaxID=2931391 RepID=A0ABT3B9T9_9RHOB|nr:anti-sigma factor [Roseobacter sp. WL0113]MCV3270326.1 anti-sigma factor [Roseobacter sp. WL0113]
MQDHERLSAFLDGELSEAEAREIEKELEGDPALLAEFEAIREADRLALEEFDTMLREPVPFDLAKAIQEAPDDHVANATGAPRRSPPWGATIAALIALMIGGIGGYWAGQSQDSTLAAAPGWLQDIADYHAVYATQTRHLVEVPASEREHIQTWLTNTVGTNVAVPDLSAQGLEFQGARLLVAAGKPVAQLMYLDADQRVVALCLIATEAPREGFAAQTIGAFGMVSWGGAGANFVVVGDQDRTDLSTIAEAAATQV